MKVNLEVKLFNKVNVSGDGTVLVGGVEKVGNSKKKEGRKEVINME